MAFTAKTVIERNHLFRGLEKATLERIAALATRRLYQEGPVTNMRSPEELIKLYTGGDKLKVGTAMFCGTFAVHGEISYSGTFDMELEDPVLGRKLTHGYKIVSLPDEG